MMIFPSITALHTRHVLFLHFSFVLGLALSSSMHAWAETTTSPPTATTQISHDNLSSNDILSYYQPSPLPLAKGVYCPGTWIQPSSVVASSPSVDNSTESPIYIEANEAYHDGKNRSELSGEVRITQANTSIYADNALLQHDSELVTAKGNARIETPQVTAIGNQIEYNLKTQMGAFEQSQFIDNTRGGMGSAQRIVQNNPDKMTLDQVRYSTCPPHQKAWEIQARQLKINQKTGRGSSQGTLFNVYNKPIFYLPYFNFPIDERRLTGLLPPTINLVQGPKITLPIYLNVHPQLDMTIAPTLFGSQIPSVDTEIRYLSQHLGQGSVEVNTVFDPNIYLVKINHHIDQPYHIDNLRFDLTYNEASHTDFFKRISAYNFTESPTYLTRMAAFTYNNQNNLNAVLKVQGFQKIDTSISDANKPYTRLPQLLVSWSPEWHDHIVTNIQSDIGYFTKTILDQSTLPNNGARLFNRIQFDYPYEQTWGYVRPSVQLSQLAYHYDKKTQEANGLSHQDATQNIFVPRVSIEQGFIFSQQQAQQKQTLEPRLKYSYAPYQAQDHLPIYDTVAIPYQYEQLFADDRFFGRDRLGDDNTISVGLTHRRYNAQEEELRIAIGEQYYLSPRQVTLTESSKTQDRRSGVSLNIKKNLDSGLSAQIDHRFLPDYSTAYHSLHLNWQKPTDSAYANTQNPFKSLVAQSMQQVSLGFITRDLLADGTQVFNRQITASFVSERIRQWALVGYSQFDTDANRFRDSLIGADYQSCCYRIGFYSRNVYDNVQNLDNLKPHRQFQAEISFKGFNNLSSRLAKMLQQKIPLFKQLPP